MRILLISGHGAGDPGATGTYKRKKYKEADLTREVVSAVAEKLKEYASVTVYDQSRNAYTDYCNGLLNKYAQFSKYDFVLEIHFNAFKPDAGDGKNKGVEIFAKPGSNIEPTIVKNISALGFRNRGVKSNGFAVINTARSKGVRAALLEICFIDDADDMAIYLDNKDEVVDSIVKGFGLKKMHDPLASYKENIKAKAGLSDSTIDYLEDYKYGADLLKKLSNAMK